MGFREEISKIYRETVLSDKIFFRIIDTRVQEVESDEQFVCRMNGNVDTALVVRVEI